MSGKTEKTLSPIIKSVNCVCAYLCTQTRVNYMHICASNISTNPFGNFIFLHPSIGTNLFSRYVYLHIISKVAMPERRKLFNFAVHFIKRNEGPRLISKCNNDDLRVNNSCEEVQRIAIFSVCLKERLWAFRSWGKHLVICGFWVNL